MKQLCLVRVTTCPPQFITMNYLGELTGESEKHLKLKGVSRVVEVMSLAPRKDKNGELLDENFQPCRVSKQPAARDAVVNEAILSETMLGEFEIPFSDISAWGLVDEKTSPKVFKLLKEKEMEERVQKAGLVMPNGREANP